MARPGIIIVTSRPTAADFTADDLNKWYLKKHIPDVLATDGVQAALWCQLTALAGQVDEQAPPAPYLAVYYLPDLDWLHKEKCGFWKLPMELDAEDGRKGLKIFDVAEFSTASWELDAGLQLTGPTPRWPVTPGGDEEAIASSITGAEILGYTVLLQFGDTRIKGLQNGGSYPVFGNGYFE
ncbi:hypothetical protein C8A01DRAFT_32003 [Parachaetomium inaequale]|uniref:EthD domain-containing protein n=1 Tax=Parachaetomium inaequale TaxID=2588326 RepID=A0AAN6PPL7_9PEZI|nr:hypothetical protein C8A01DRAFT_32003 [Parachaetomium inaequale]